MELILGAGHDRTRRIAYGPNRSTTFSDDAVFLDINPDAKPDVIFDLDLLTIGRPLPFDHNTFAEIHAYEVLEHIGQQGDHVGFFNQFYELWRVLEPDGVLCGSVPHPTSPWAWGDPGHRRVLPVEVFTFLSQKQYDEQLGKTSLSDYRAFWRGDFELVYSQVEGEGMGSKVATQLFALRAVK